MENKIYNKLFQIISDEIQEKEYPEGREGQIERYMSRLDALKKIENEIVEIKKNFHQGLFRCEKLISGYGFENANSCFITCLSKILSSLKENYSSVKDFDALLSETKNSFITSYNKVREQFIEDSEKTDNIITIEKSNDAKKITSNNINHNIGGWTEVRMELKRVKINESLLGQYITFEIELILHIGNQTYKVSSRSDKLGEFEYSKGFDK